MASTYTSNLRLELQATGENNNTWGIKANSDFTQLDQAIAGYTTIALTNTDVCLTVNNATSDQSRPAMLEFAGVLTSSLEVFAPAGVTKQYWLRNATTGAFTVTMKITSGSGLVIPQGGTIGVFTDGVSVYQAPSRLQTLEVASSVSLGGNLAVAGTLAVPGATSLTGAVNITGAVSGAGGLTISGSTSVGALTVAAVSASSLALTTPLSITSGGTGTTAGSGVIQIQTTVFSGVSASGGVALPVDNTIPTSTEGTQMLLMTMTPRSASSKLRVQASGMFSLNFTANNKGAISLVRDTTGSAFAARAATWPSADEYVSIYLESVVSSNAASATNFSIRIGPNNASDNLRVNGNSGGQLFGGVSPLTLTVTEFTSVT